MTDEKYTMDKKIDLLGWVSELRSVLAMGKRLIPQRWWIVPVRLTLAIEVSPIGPASCLETFICAWVEVGTLVLETQIYILASSISMLPKRCVFFFNDGKH